LGRLYESGEYPTDVLNSVAIGRALPVRAMDRFDAEVRIFHACIHIAGVYGGQKSVAKEILAECADLVLTRFQFIGADEIITAWRMASAGELGVDPALYGGSFNAERLSRVLTAYGNARKGIVAEISKQEDLIDMERFEARRKDPSFRERLDQETMENMERYRKEGAYLDRPEDIGAWMYDFLERTGHLSLTPDEKWALMEKGAQLARKDSHESLSNATTEADRSRLRRVLAELDDDFNKDGQERVKLYAKKIAVHQWLYPEMYSI